jgi:NOL1/NOP2/fmu family ribosome biogenesis protein
MDVWDTLKPGGILIYSTCTFNPAENEENVAWLADQHHVENIEIPVNPEWGIEVVYYKGIIGYRFIYHRVRGEGFFVSVLQKKAGTDFQSKQGKSTVGMPVTKVLRPKLESMVNKGNQFLINDTVYNVPYDLRYLSAVLGNINIVRPGCKMATVIRDEVKPSHFLALSGNLNMESFQIAELDNNQENFTLPDTVKGLYLATWKGLPVGFINHLGNRLNTSLPLEYRILKPFPFHGESLATVVNR